MNYKAIETVYKGYRFRSRLEARWAVFFDTLNIEYRYEPEGFDLDGIWYLPDFYLSAQRCWLEIKPDIPMPDEREKAIRLCLATQQSVALFGGDVWHDTKNQAMRYGFKPTRGYTREELDAFFGAYPPPKNARVQWLTQNEVMAWDGRRLPYGYDLGREYVWSASYVVECSDCGAVGIEMPSGIYPCDKSCKGKMRPTTERLKKAYTAARQARFDGRDES